MPSDRSTRSFNLSHTSGTDSCAAGVGQVEPGRDRGCQDRLSVFNGESLHLAAMVSFHRKGLTHERSRVQAYLPPSIDIERQH